MHKFLISKEFQITIILLIGICYQSFGQGSIYYKESLFKSDFLDVRFNEFEELVFDECGQCENSFIHSIGYRREIKLINRFFLEPDISLNFHKKLLSRNHKMIGSNTVTNGIYFHGVNVSTGINLRFNFCSKLPIFVGAELNFLYYISRKLKSEGSSYVFKREKWNEKFFNYNSMYFLNFGYIISQKVLVKAEIGKFIFPYHNIYNAVNIFRSYQDKIQYGISIAYLF